MWKEWKDAKFHNQNLELPSLAAAQKLSRRGLMVDENIFRWIALTVAIFNSVVIIFGASWLTVAAV